MEGGGRDGEMKGGRWLEGRGRREGGLTEKGERKGGRWVRGGKRGHLGLCIWVDIKWKEVRLLMSLVFR